MRKTLILILAVILIIQIAPVLSLTRSLSVKDFEHSRRAYCEIFTEPH